jgi:hypothetical protein
MSEVGDLFKEWSKDKQAKRAQNKDISTAMLRNARVEFTSHNEGAHLIVQLKDRTIDFWPSTGLWSVRGTAKTKRARGVAHLLAYIRAHS